MKSNIRHLISIALLITCIITQTVTAQETDEPTGGSSSSDEPTGGSSSSDGPTAGGGGGSDGPTSGGSGGSDEPTSGVTSPEPTKSPTKPPKSDAQCGNYFCPKDLLNVVIKTDKTVKQNSMSVKRRLGNKGEFKTMVMFTRDFEPLQENSLNACIDIKKFCYQLIVNDKKGNGISKGFVRMFVNGKSIYGNKFSKGDKLRKNFGKCN